MVSVSPYPQWHLVLPTFFMTAFIVGRGLGVFEQREFILVFSQSEIGSKLALARQAPHISFTE